MSAPAIHRLANGVTVVCDRAEGFETLALSVVAGRGARHEDARRSGWSHLLEHMVFKGAGERSAKVIVEAIESEGGQINAATGQERTSFQVRALAGGLPLALAVTADLVLRPTLDPDDLAKEVQVVGQEIAEAADTPDDQVFELAQAAAFAGQPLGRPILGTMESIGAADPATLEAWRGAVYAPDRLVVTAAGAVDEDEVLKLAQDLFGSAIAPDQPAQAPDAAFTGGQARERRKLEQAHLVFMLPAPGIADPDHWALRLFAEMLGGGMSSRLFQEARERLGLAYAIDAWAEAWADTGALGIYGGRCRTPRRCGRRAGARAGGGGRGGGARPRQGAAQGFALHGSRIPGCPRRAGRGPDPGLRPAADAGGGRGGHRGGDRRGCGAGGGAGPGPPARGLERARPEIRPGCAGPVRRGVVRVGLRSPQARRSASRVRR